MLVRTALAVVAGFCLIAVAHAAETWPPVIARKLPPVPKEPLSDADRAQVTAALVEIRSGLKTLPPFAKPKYDVNEDRALQTASAGDVEIFAKALDYALRNNEFFDAKKSLQQAETLRKAAVERIAAIQAGDFSWTKRPGTLVRGFQSKLDDSYQPYGVVIPAGLDLSKPVPLYVWLHGRGDTMCDLQFIYAHSGTKPPGPLQPPGAIVLHPFGRYCNGFKSAGEIDVLEAIRDVSEKYKIDPDRIVLAGFSMGGAGAWHLGAHYADRWCAVHAGAGFVDVRRYQALTPEMYPPPVERTLWGLYDVPDYRRNLLNVPVVAYSGEEDKQKAAADIMEAELAAEGYKIPHLIGPKMGHKYDPEVLKDIHARLAKLVEQGRDPYPKKIALQTKTLRYSKMHWLDVMALDKHWEDARVDADQSTPGVIRITTKNVKAMFIEAPKSGGKSAPFSPETRVEVDGQLVSLNGAKQLHSLALDRRDGRWVVDPDGQLRYRTIGFTLNDPAYGTFPFRKAYRLQGPIDDAFTRPFTVVPAAPAGSDLISRWAAFESEHFAERWRLLMRGELPTTTSAEVAAEPRDVDRNLVLWGTPRTNPLIAKLLDKLPITWTDETVGMGDLKFDAKKVVPVLIYPNPDSPEYYVVLNSGLTFREAHDRTNSLQNPKLGDWAFIDVTEPPTDEAPGKVLAAGFFDEQWKYVQPKK